MGVRQINGHATWKKASASFSEAILSAGNHFNEGGKRVMQKACEDWIKETDAEWPHHSEGRSYFGGAIKVLNGAKFGGDRWHPWYSGHLHDSIGVRVSDGNRTVGMYFMPPAATGKQKDDNGNSVVGATCAIDEMQKASRVLLPGIQAQLVVGVPYARKVDESPRHTGFLQELNVQFSSRIADEVTWMLEDYVNGHHSASFFDYPKRNEDFRIVKNK